MKKIGEQDLRSFLERGQAAQKSVDDATPKPKVITRTITFRICSPDASPIAVGIFKGMKTIAAGIMSRYKDTAVSVVLDPLQSEADTTANRESGPVGQEPDRS